MWSEPGPALYHLHLWPYQGCSVSLQLALPYTPPPFSGYLYHFTYLRCLFLLLFSRDMSPDGFILKVCWCGPGCADCLCATRPTPTNLQNNIVPYIIM